MSTIPFFLSRAKGRARGAQLRLYIACLSISLPPFSMLKPFSRICAPRLVARPETWKPVFAMRRWLKIKAPRILSPSTLHPPPRNFPGAPGNGYARAPGQYLARSIRDRSNRPRSSINNRVRHLSSRICSPDQDGARKDRCFPSNVEAPYSHGYARSRRSSAPVGSVTFTTSSSRSKRRPASIVFTGGQRGSRRRG